MPDNLITAVFLAAIALIVCIAWAVSAVLQKIEAEASDTLGRHAASPDLRAETMGDGRTRACIPLSGREVFFPAPPAGATPVYDIVLSGVIYTEDRRSSADAMYSSDDLGNFTRARDWIKVNGTPLLQTIHATLESDRYRHRYQVRVDGRQDRLTLSFNPHYHRYAVGSFTAEVLLLPPGTQTVAEWRRLNEAARIVHPKNTEAARKFAADIQALTIRAQLYPNWADPSYRERFAKAYHADLIQHQAEIRKEAAEVLEQHELLSYLQRHHPVVPATLLGRLDALNRAERVSLDKAIAGAEPQEALPPRRKLTAAQVREKIVRREEIELEDRLAVAKLRVAKLEGEKARVQQEYAHLDEDERTRITQQILDEIDQAENQHGKTL